MECQQGLALKVPFHSQWVRRGRPTGDHLCLPRTESSKCGLSQMAPSTRGHSHIIDLDVTVIRSSNKELGIRGKSQGADGHGVA